MSGSPLWTDDSSIEPATNPHQLLATLKQSGYTVNSDGTVTAQYVANGNTGVRAVTIAPKGSNPDYWSGIDTNFTLRAKYGIRLTGGTSTGRRNVSTCELMVDDPPTGQVLEEGRERTCDRGRIFQTNMRGTASYTIPWIDVLASTTFSYRPGVQITGSYQVAITDLNWISGGRYVPSQLSGVANSFVTPNLLSNDTYGEGIRLVDIKLAKNIRFARKRVNLGADIFNALNSDAALGYCGTLPSPSQGITGCAGGVPWRAVNNITTPRYVRFQMQFDF